MYTVCPKCQNIQEIRAQQLQKILDKVICTECGNPFNPRITLIDSLSQLIDEDDNEDDIEENETDTYAWQKPVNSHSGLWFIGSLLGVLLLVYQVHYFKSYDFSQSAQIRPWLTAISNLINKPLSPYKNAQELTIIGSSFVPIDKDHYRLQVGFINHANFSQALPYLKLTLQNLYGAIVAQRTLTPKDYLSNNSGPALITRNSTFNIDLVIIVPDQEIGGYQVELQ